MSKFEPNAIIRGTQLTLVGTARALQNPALFTSEHYRQAGIAILGGIAIRLLVAIPVSLAGPSWLFQASDVHLDYWHQDSHPHNRVLRRHIMGRQCSRRFALH